MKNKSPAKQYLTAEEAIDLLKIKKDTLYSYVSRGLLRSVATQGSAKERLYIKEDLLRLQTRSRVKSGHAAVAASAMNLGDPIVPTRITEITVNGPSYRGKLAIDLAQQRFSFEQVSEMLWSGILHAGDIRWPSDSTAVPSLAWLKNFPRQDAENQIVELFAAIALNMSLGRGSIHDRLLAGRTVDAARQILTTLVGCFGLLGPRGRYIPAQEGSGIAANLLRATDCRQSPENIHFINALLILLADHELSPGTFAVRIAASSGCALHSCLAAAMTTSSGTEVARIYELTDQFLNSAKTARTLLAKARALLAAGQKIPGFEHPLYPDGDPRAVYLLGLLRSQTGASAQVRRLLAFVDQLQAEHGLHARHELALVVACKAIGLPAQAPPALFVLARTAGWVSHVLEQRLSETTLRPRAQFIHN